MVRKFKCKSCNRVYEADEMSPNCVYCGSDNVTPYKPMSPVIKIAAISVAGLVVGFVCVKVVSLALNFKGHSESIAPANEQTLPSSSGVANLPTNSTPKEDSNVGNGEALMEISSGKPIIASVKEPVYSNGAYSLEVTASADSGDDLVYYLYASGKVDPVAYSSNGKFKNIPPAEDETGVYTLEVKNSRTGESTSKPIPGFVKQVEKTVTVKKLSAGDLQNMFNSGSVPSSAKPCFARGYKIVCSGLAEDESAPDRYEEILNRLIASWSSVVVTSLSYNDKNQITSIHIKVVY